MAIQNIKYNNKLFNINNNETYNIIYDLEDKLKKFKLEIFLELDYIRYLTNQKLNKRKQKLNEIINSFIKLK